MCMHHILFGYKLVCGFNAAHPLLLVLMYMVYHILTCVLTLLLAYLKLNVQSAPIYCSFGLALDRENKIDKAIAQSCIVDILCCLLLEVKSVSVNSRLRWSQCFITVLEIDV